MQGTHTNKYLFLYLKIYDSINCIIKFELKICLINESFFNIYLNYII